MKNKSIILGFAGVLLICFIYGAMGTVTLANAEAGEADTESKDRLIGIFVTTDYLDLFDFEGYLNDNINKVMDGTVNVRREDSAKYNGRLYAELVDKTLTDTETGRTSTTKEYVFEGTEGFLYYGAKIEEDGESYYASSGDEAISDGHLGITVTDVGESVDMEGTIYMSAFGTKNCLYFNPVYQTDDGEVYAVAGHGYSFSGEISEGMIGSVMLEETNSYTINGETAETGTKIKMSYAFMYAPVEIIVTQMSGDNQVVDSREYKPGELPEELIMMADTEYIIVETVKMDNSGKEIHTREMYQQDIDIFQTFFCREDGICVEKSTKVIWSEYWSE